MRERTPSDTAPGPDRPQRGIQSIEVGGQLLQALVHHGRPMALKDLAREADMSAAKAHPYMVSFGRIGLVAQDDASGHYRLGPLAVQLGLIGLQQADPVQAATPLLAPLAQALGHTVALAVWGERGATIVRIAEADTPLRVTLRHGTVFSLAHTASGRLFGAHLAPEGVRTRLEAERRRVAREAWEAQETHAGQEAPQAPAAGMPTARPVPEWPVFEAELAEVRARGLSRSEGEIVPGISAMAAPVFEPAGAMVLALVAIGPAATFDSRWSGAVARDLLACAREISARLGRV